jgi:soluble lytic murein transglycosylase-like protein
MDALKAFAPALALLAAAPANSSPPADRVGRWQPLIAEASARLGVPADWIARVMRAESGGNTMLDGRPITSRAGAMGLMQLMPGTWNAMRARLDLGRDPHDPEDNILAGTAYLRAMYERFGYPGLFAAYNAGPERYAQYLHGERALPRETRAYLAQLGHEPAAPATRFEALARPLNAIFFALGDGRAAAEERPSERPETVIFVPLGSHDRAPE